MTKGLIRSLSRGTQLTQVVVKEAIPIRNLDMTITDVSGQSGWGTVVVGSLPQGNMLYLGAVAYVQLSSVSAGITNTFSGNVALGTAPTADNTLSGAEVDLLPSTAVAAATGKVSPLTRVVSTDALGGGIFDNQDGSLEFNLNVLIADAGITANSVVTVNGVLHITYILRGDN
jgi:hypothetical protein